VRERAKLAAYDQLQQLHKCNAQILVPAIPAANVSAAAAAAANVTFAVPAAAPAAAADMMGVGVADEFLISVSGNANNSCTGLGR